MCLKSLKLSLLVFTLLVIANANENGNEVTLEYDDAPDSSKNVELKENIQKSEETTQLQEVVSDELISVSQSLPDLTSTTESILVTSVNSEQLETSPETSTVFITLENPETVRNPDVSEPNSSTITITEEAFSESTLIPKVETSTESEATVSTENVTENDTQHSKTPGSDVDELCPTGDSLKEKIDEIIKENVPNKVMLTDAKMGHRIPVILENGFLKLGTGKLNGDPSCQQGTDERVYTFFMDFNDIRGAYEWKLYHLFGNNLTESALLTLDNLKVEFTFVEKKSLVGERISLKKLSLSSLQNLNVKVNIPEKIMEIKVVNRAISFITSRVTTFVMNRSKAAIAKNFEASFVKAVKDKSAIHP